LVASSRREFTLADWLGWFETLHPKKIDLSLDRVFAVLDKLELRPPPYKVVTVAGTNGKGSCVAMLESIYWHAGYEVGAFTSPHLWRFNERIRVNGADAADAELLELFETIDASLGAITLSYFEVSTVAALLHFARRKVDVAVLEVGMGGRLDASNTVDADCALIVSIDLDHREWLGEDREAIGREKAGIMRRDKPVVLADRDPPRSVLAHAAAVGALPYLIGRDFDYLRETGDGRRDAGGGASAGDDGARAGGTRRGWRRARSPDDSPLLPLPPFGGEEQYGNAAACAAVVERLGAALPVGDSALAAGIRNAYLRGRLERHVVDGVEWVFDVGHNPAAASVLASSLAKLPRARRTFAVFAGMRDKDLAGVFAPLVAGVDGWFVTQANAERGATGAELEDILVACGARCVQTAPDVASACQAARAAAARDERVLVFGSFHTVGAATAALGLYCAPSRAGEQPSTWTRA
jgi:dihydrofolate synthase/folylpolyglutamate synthase